ncbi:MAG: pyridoxamine 5'-phosphate oxidase family protein [Proteobacteria bacterium]|nr:pyridoxamine 5'-phosphate oxidase family protein [Pseudomonadota bacterium]
MTLPFYGNGARTLQDRFDSRRLADRLEQVTLRRAFTDEDRAFIARAPMFFLATADSDGRPDCSYKGGLPGFVHVVDDTTLAFPSYDGNGQFRSLGNLLSNPHLTTTTNSGHQFAQFTKFKRK